MDGEIIYTASIVVQRQDEIDSNEYLLQVDTDAKGRVFINLNRLILAIKDGSFNLARGEHFYESNKSEEIR
jgi:hypothetical protein